MCKAVVGWNVSVSLIVQSVANDAIEVKQNVSSKLSLSRYFEYILLSGQSSQKQIFRPDLAFCVVRMMLVNLVVCATGSRRGLFVYIDGWQKDSSNCLLLSDIV